MTKDGGQRIATPDGAMLADPIRLGNAAGHMFDPLYWAGRGELDTAARGRGSAWFITSGARRWVLRHYRRGGLIARVSADWYVWSGESRVRAFVEWRLLARLAQLALPVPTPIGARYQRRGFFYRCDLITERIVGAEPLSAHLAHAPLPATTWRDIGRAVARCHAAGVDHADLNAHNILIDERGAVSVIDFDRGRWRRAGAWTAANLSRLQRSLVKIARDLPPQRFPAAAWEALLAGYASPL